MNDVETISRVREAVKAGDVHKVSALIGDDKVLLNKMTVFGTWLHMAAAHGRLNVVEYLIERGVEINRRGGISGDTAIGGAASKGHLDIVRFLLVRGATLDVSEPERNPLFRAIYGGHLEIVKLLVGAGIDFRVKYTGESMKNMDALGFARERGQSEIAAYLASLQK